MNILGVHLYSNMHDTSAAIIRDGKICAAVSEERLTRLKNEGNFPSRSIKSVLALAGLSPSDIDVVAVAGLEPSWKMDTTRIMKFYRVYPERLSILFKAPNIIRGDLQHIFAQKKKKNLSRLKMLRDMGFDCEINFVEHHLAHAAGAFFTSGWKDCLTVTLDGEGDNIATTINVCDHAGIHRIASSDIPHSAGLFYKHVTRCLGFKPSRHAGKITGLAAMGKPLLLDKVQPLLQCDNLTLKTPKLLQKLEHEYFVTKKLPAYYDNASREDIAASFQKVLEDTVTKLIQNAINITGLNKIALAGGVAANVKLNQRIRDLPGVENVYIYPPMGDDGISLGAALWTWFTHETQNNGKPTEIKDVYLGPSFSESEITSALNKYKLDWQEIRNVESYIADQISKGKVIGWFQGRMEYGPRALGNRSILVQPTDKKVNDTLNKRMRRSEFMPFAPSTMDKYAAELYKGYLPKHFTSKFMTITYNVTRYGAKAAPACTHVDKTARPQVVDKKTNSSYYKILQKYHGRTGLPCFINTSFNMHEEPIVCTPEDAIDSFLRDCVDILCLDKFVVVKNPNICK